MKKSVILIISTILLASCSPKKPAATTTPATQAITTTAVFKTQANKSNTSNTSNTKKTVAVSNAGNNNENTKANESEGAVTKAEEGQGASNNSSNESSGSSNEGSSNQASSNESSENKAIDDLTIATPAIEANGKQVKLPASSDDLESAGLVIDWNSKKYSDAYGKNYVHADFNGKDIILGLSSDDKINEIYLTGTDAIKIPGGFSVGSSKQAFRDAFGYWGGDLYNINGSIYEISGNDTIDSITIKAE